jgi:hypothetical protein
MVPFIGEMLLLANHVGFYSPLPTHMTGGGDICLLGQDQISVGKKHSATLLLNMGIICACKSFSISPTTCQSLSPRGQGIRQSVQVYCVLPRTFN